MEACLGGQDIVSELDLARETLSTIGRAVLMACLTQREDQKLLPRKCGGLTEGGQKGLGLGTAAPSRD